MPRIPGDQGEMIELCGVSLQRGNVTILDRITLSVGPEVVALVGPSGSGKTTLLRVLLGLETPSSGEVKIGDRLASAPNQIVVPPEERNVAMVFQDLALWPHLSVHGNLAFGLKARGVSKSERERRISETLSWVGLTSKAELRPNALSGGERQRVAIARALVLEPAAVLLDEPLGSLDVALKAELIALFARLFEDLRVPIVYVAHDPGEVSRLAARVVVLEGGRVVQDGSLAALSRAPSTPFIDAFLRGALGR